MTRKNAIITGMVGLSALAMGAPAARAEDSKEANPEVEKIRELLKAHDEAMTNQDLKGVMACYRKGRDHGYRSWRDLGRP